MAFHGFELLKFIIALTLRITFDLICLLLSPIIYLYYRSICNTSIKNGSRKEFNSIFITGASSGMGKSTAHYLAKQSKSRSNEMILHLTGRNIERLNSVKQECLELGGITSNLKVHTYVMDITNQVGMASIVLGADDMKPLDLIFANAGINFSMCNTFEFIESCRQLVNVNISGTLNTIFPIIPRLMLRKQGHIAINASLASYTNRSDCAAYAATKVFLRFLCEVMHWGLHNYYNIGVSVVNPGYVRTAMYEATSNAAIKEDVRPGSLSEDAAAEFIVKGLENNEYSIDFPFSLMCVAWMLGSAHPIIRTCLGKVLVKQRMIDQVFPMPEANDLNDEEE